jgi:hypothetical protein
LKESSDQLPLILTTLQFVEEQCRNDDGANGGTNGATVVMERCRDKSKQLQYLVSSVYRGEEARWFERYKAAVRAVRKRGTVEELTNDIMRGLKLLETDHILAHLPTSARLDGAISRLERVEKEESSSPTGTDS